MFCLFTFFPFVYLFLKWMLWNNSSFFFWPLLMSELEKIWLYLLSTIPDTNQSPVEGRPQFKLDFFFLLLYNDYVKEVKFRKDGNWYCCGTSFRDRILQQLKKMKPSSLTIIIQSRRRRSIFFSGSVFLFIVLDDNFENDKVKLRGLFLVAALQFANGTRKGEKRKCFILFFLSI